MNNEDIEKISQRTGISQQKVRAALKYYGIGLHYELSKGEKSSINILGLGSFRVKELRATYDLQKRLLPYARIYKSKLKEQPDNEFYKESYERIKAMIKYIWVLRRDAQKYMSRRNAQYYPSKDEQKD